MSVLLKFIVGDNDPMQLVQVETKEDGKMQVHFYHFLPFVGSNYGALILNFWDGLPMEKHVELLNEMVRFWDAVGQPRGLLEAMFYSAFENDLVYPDALEEWKDQEPTPRRSEEWGRGVVKKQADVRLSDTVFQIQEFLDSQDYEWSVCLNKQGLRDRFHMERRDDDSSHARNARSARLLTHQMAQQLPVRAHELLQFLRGGRDLIALRVMRPPRADLQPIHDHRADHARLHACAPSERQEQQRLHLDVAHARSVEFAQKGELVRLFVPCDHSQSAPLLAEKAVRATLVLVEPISRQRYARHHGNSVLFGEHLEMTNHFGIRNRRVLVVLRDDGKGRRLPFRERTVYRSDSDQHHSIL